MKSKSCYSKIIDPYRAGVAIAQQLAEIKPEVIFLFTSIHYLREGLQDLLDALFLELSPLKPILIGNTGDGVYATGEVADIGVSALGINSEGRVQWHYAEAQGLKQYPNQATQQCIQQLKRKCKQPAKLGFLAADFRTDSSEILSAIHRFADYPILGGLAADDYAIKDCFVLGNQSVLTDSLVMIAMEGDFSFEIQVGHCPITVGKPGEITEVHGTEIISIDGIPAMSFLEREMGKPLDHVDTGILAFKTIPKDRQSEYKVRSMLLPDDRDLQKSVKVFGGVEQGEKIQLCVYPPQQMIEDLKQISSRLGQIQFKPKAALVVSCAGRKIVLGNEIQRETRDVFASWNKPIALAGYPSFGEFGPIMREQGYSPTLFHNMTYVLLVLGESES